MSWKFIKQPVDNPTKPVRTTLKKSTTHFFTSGMQRQEPFKLHHYHSVKGWISNLRPGTSRGGTRGRHKSLLEQPPSTYRSNSSDGCLAKIRVQTLVLLSIRAHADVCFEAGGHQTLPGTAKSRETAQKECLELACLTLTHSEYDSLLIIEQTSASNHTHNSGLVDLPGRQVRRSFPKRSTHLRRFRCRSLLGGKCSEAQKAGDSYTLEKTLAPSTELTRSSCPSAS